MPSTAMYRWRNKKAKERAAQHMARGATIGAASCTDAHTWYVSWAERALGKNGIFVGI